MITFILIAVTVLVSWQAFEKRRIFERLVLWPPGVERFRQYDRLLTHGFVHADWMHLLFNMITLYFFGRAVEGVFAQLVGQAMFVLFYLSAIVVAILPSYLRHRKDGNYVSLGASGAVSAVLFAFVLVDPWSWIIVFVIPVPAVIYAVAYIGYSYWMDKRGRDSINHNAHLSGAIYGLLFVLLMEPGLGLRFLQKLASPSLPGFFG
ncbi:MULTISPECIES: rhomboid family intramembrane serine protease [unclassified Lysobacter]|uniref:rhomboid family intramembrane serine protease n=1 Tax=unclassified Lysobacter TaxID=2635362 RepID=UPI001BE86B6C|nr:MULTISPECIES: rhomboid family intramembrane serine protease [unclassified Lysobacter]MBT2748898.1 rhomboid family intramembrane serine protease [Lysobacter sp. ISL-42]MBT2753074.1 rhomboid family intramembrane serine protease [Lysobacter sp. ISL-50]MBT2777243.1 rhomboid family intramembrane serine protease [Lysobacter sp. ISL-54]MBT2783223.1 rhomboid family intramembrane serine protease [Lysobacter sp. ISL-52]